MDDTFKQNMATLKQYAEEHVIDQDTQKEFIPGDHPEYTTYAHDGFKIVYTIATATSPDTGKLLKCRHLSVSVDTPGRRVPSIAAVEFIMHSLGMPHKITEVDNVYLEEFAPNHQAVNVIEIIQP